MEKELKNINDLTENEIISIVEDYVILPKDNFEKLYSLEYYEEIKNDEEYYLDLADFFICDNCGTITHIEDMCQSEAILTTGKICRQCIRDGYGG